MVANDVLRGVTNYHVMLQKLKATTVGVLFRLLVSLIRLALERYEVGFLETSDIDREIYSIYPFHV